MRKRFEELKEQEGETEYTNHNTRNAVVYLDTPSTVPRNPLFGTVGKGNGPRHGIYIPFNSRLIWTQHI